MRFWILFGTAYLGGCAAPTNTPGSADLAVTVLADLSTASTNNQDAAPDLSKATCTLGDPDHCGTCTNVCPPGMDDATTKRTCSGATAFATCGYICRGQFYEIDGKDINGCEAEDAPAQDTAANAVAVNLPNTPLAASPGPNLNPTNILQQIYGDMMEHETPPSSRPNGLDDWYRLVVSGGGAGDRGVGACLGISSFPPDNTFAVCLSANGATNFVPAGCKQVVGGAASVCVQQPMAADESGTYYVRVQRVSGATYTANQYALYLDH